ncbi:hypothetical protein B0H11DRAFT_2193210 [Mycena galericulata]|nr:hypothetical protein B0H11DRAFT_2193210 [Mycena galericulata]
MSSIAVARLRTRIDEFSSSISRQQKVLRDLENQRSAVQIEFNSVLDPVARLPLEISSDIFRRCLPTPPEFNPSQVPVIFLTICHSWSNIALSTPSLWTDISDRDVSMDKFLNLFEHWLKHARRSPLSLSLEASLHPRSSSNSRTVALVKQYAHQIQSLELCVHSGEDLERLTAPFNILETLTLRTLLSEGSFSQTANECVEILRAAPRLVECSLININYAEDIHTSSIISAPLTHHSLKHLRISSTIILQYFTLPALQSLAVLESDITPSNVLSFLNRSSPPLRSLHLKGYHVADTVADYLRIVPGLTDLCVDNRNMSAAILYTLASPGLAPNLRNLNIAGRPTRLHYERVLDLLTSRRASLQSFCFTFGMVLEVPNDIIIPLRQLAQDGMQIHIGMEYNNAI